MVRPRALFTLGLEPGGTGSYLTEDDHVMVSRTSKLAGLAMVGALALTSCGNGDNNATTSPTSSSKISCATGDLKGAGSTFQKNIVAEWIKDYTAACTGAKLDYQGIGSGAGIKQFGAGTIDFAGSDSTMKDDEQAAADKNCGSPAIHLPVTAGGIAIAYNLKDVKGLQLSPATIAGIFMGKITTWDNAAIKADNPTATLPSTAITAVHRDDSSGTTGVFSKYLEATAGAAWTLGNGKELKWPAAIQGAAKSDGVTQAVASSEGGVTYVEDSFVTSGGLQAAKVKNGAGEYTALGTTSVTAALAGATLPASGNDLKVTYDFTSAAPGAYPITALSYEIVCTKAKDAAKQALLKSFLTYAVTTGQASAGDAGFAPLPASVVTRVTTAISALS
ncbi:MAG: pstS [Frankiales bacterium]|nr:pstS [Frankiales bacterium]